MAAVTLRIAVFVLLASCGAESAPTTKQSAQPPSSPVATAPTQVAIAPGAPLALRVRVTRPDGSPARNAGVRVYHTDADGYYLKAADGSEAGGEHARLAFTVMTDADGRFTLSTIVPARYPQGGPPPHVHLHIPPDHPEDLTIMFDHDPSLDRARIAKMARTWIGRVRVEGSRVICEADIVAPL